MGILWYACAAPLWAATLWPALDWSPTERVVECSVTEVFPDGGKTPSGSFTVVLTPSDQMGVPKGATRLEGSWIGDPTLFARIKAVDPGEGRFPLDVFIENSIVFPDHGDDVQGRTNAVGSSFSETTDDFLLQVNKADGFGGHYEFAFHRKYNRWFEAWLP